MILFGSTFFAVFLLSFQQQNVVKGNYRLAVVTAFAIALSQFLMFRSAVSANANEWWLMGIAGSIGVTLSMYVHKRYIKNGS